MCSWLAPVLSDGHSLAHSRQRQTRYSWRCVADCLEKSDARSNRLLSDNTVHSITLTDTHFLSVCPSHASFVCSLAQRYFIWHRYLICSSMCVIRKPETIKSWNVDARKYRKEWWPQSGERQSWVVTNPTISQEYTTNNHDTALVYRSEFDHFLNYSIVI